MNKNWVRLLLLLTAVVLVNLSTFFVLDDNLKKGVYPPDGDTIIIGIIDTASLSLLTLPFLMVISIVPVNSFIQRRCQRTSAWYYWVGVLVSISYFAALGMMSIGLFIWSIPHHYTITVFYTFTVIVIIACFLVDIKSFYALRI